MDTMKKAFFIILLMAASFGMEAQQPLSFINRDYTQKLDSVVGSNDFGMTRWKTVFAYPGDTIVSITYYWEEEKWAPSEKKEASTGQELFFRWAEGGWEPYSKTAYEYDADGHLILQMHYNGMDTLGQWIESAKYDYIYGESGLLDTCLYSTIRNGNWRESERKIYSYDNQQCVSLLVQRKGGWGPFGNNWMDSYRYEFEYENGELASEWYYAGGGGWFGGGEMTLDSKVEYNFDANGNLQTKTASITNDGKDWIVRDIYENAYDLSVNASSVQGLELFWESFCKNGMGYAMGTAIPLKNLWKSCSVISMTLDTEFTLYCSGFAEVNEQSEEEYFKAYAFDGHLVVESLEPADVRVYDLLGRMVAQQNQVSKSEFNLTSGLYIVCVDNARVKVIVK